MHSSRTTAGRRALAVLAALGLLLGLVVVQSAAAPMASAKAKACKKGFVRKKARCVRKAAAKKTTAKKTTKKATVTTATTAEKPTDQYDRNATLRYSGSIVANSADPHVNTAETAAFTWTSLSYDRLFRLGPNGAILPMIAQSWKYSPDGKTLTVQIRRDVKFHDGTSLDAGAVVMSVNRAMYQPRSVVAGIERIINRVEAVGSDTVVFSLSRPAADLLALLAGTGGTVINPKALAQDGGTALATTEAGSGPYKLVEWVQGSKAVYERAPGYWNPDFQKVKRFELYGINDPNARINALRTGQIDMLQSLGEGGAELHRMAKGSEFEIHESNPNLYFALRFNNNRVTNVAVRQAVMRAIDRKAVSDAVFDGSCSPTVQPIAPGIPGYVKSLESDYSYNPAAARKILKDAAVPDGFKIGVNLFSQDPQRPIGEVLQSQLKAVGLNLDLNVGDAPTVNAAYNQGGADSVVLGVFSDPLPGSSMFNGVFRPIHPGTYPRDAALAKDLEARVNQTLDVSTPEAERTRILESLSRDIVSNALLVPICRQPVLSVYNHKVLGADTQWWTEWRSQPDMLEMGIKK